MHIYRTKPPRDKSEGIPLAAIVVKESSNGTWKGSASGVGLGTGGLGVFGASMSGDSSSQSVRAGQFAAPEKPREENFYANWPVIFMAFLMLAIIAIIHLAEGINKDNTGKIVLGGFLLFGAVVGLICFLATLGSNEKAERERNAGYAAYDAMRQTVYHRLRYVEEDHVVFDPETGLEISAQREYILTLIDAIVEDGRKNPSHATATTQ